MWVRGPDKYGGKLVDLPEEQARALIAAGIYKAVTIKKEKPKPEPKK